MNVLLAIVLISAFAFSTGFLAGVIFSTEKVLDQSPIAAEVRREQGR